MNSDPRLRLLGAGTHNDTATAVLAVLDDVRVVVRTGDDLHDGHHGGLAAFVAMTVRLFGHVVVENDLPLAATWWGVPDTRSLLAALAPVRPHPVTAPSHDIVVTIGQDVVPGQWGIGGDDYTVRLGRQPQPLGSATTHGLGIHAAASLAVSQLLIHVLGPLGFTGVPVGDEFTMNLVDYRLTPPPATEVDRPAEAAEPLRLAVAGAGSVGTSAMALLASALRSGPGLAAPTPTARQGEVEITIIDDDVFDPSRNPFRYTALLGGETGPKATYLAARMTALGLPAGAAMMQVADWVRTRDRPGFDGLLISSVDTLDGRLDVTDVLARSTLSLGVRGLALHAQRERFADGLACPFCDYVSADPPLTQAGVYAHMTGLPPQRILALMQDGARIQPGDLDIAVAAGRIAVQRRVHLVGARLSDLVRQAYAEIELNPRAAAPAEEGVLAVAAPQVSWFAGVVAAVEVVKQLLGMPVLDRRVDVDLSGLPPGLVRRVRADPTGRCLCHSGVRKRWYTRLYPPVGVIVNEPMSVR